MKTPRLVRLRIRVRIRVRIMGQVSRHLDRGPSRGHIVQYLGEVAREVKVPAYFRGLEVNRADEKVPI